MGHAMRSRMSDGSRRAKREYVNCLEVGFNGFEFILRFGLLEDGDRDPDVSADLIATPAHAKAFMRTLEKSLREYEELFGAVCELSADADGSS
jgi:hypothetical protein